uniref:Uncharacterized protein n=1 Tax=Timema monikensis TaxID=170555 RepID=A0A7R9HUC9_9NEOP|nr:unnamed protein product [Timema monikensis]
MVKSSANKADSYLAVLVRARTMEEVSEGVTLCNDEDDSAVEETILLGVKCAKDHDPSKRSGAGSEEIYQPTSWVFNALQFLGSCELPANVTVEVVATKEAPQTECTDANQAEQHSEDHCGSPLPQTPTVVTTPRPMAASSSSIVSLLSQQPDKKQKTQGPTAKQNELLSLACKYLANSSKEGNVNDEYLGITKVRAKKLKDVHPRQRLFAEKAINDVLFEVQLGTLHKDSVGDDVTRFLAVPLGKRFNKLLNEYLKVNANLSSTEIQFLIFFTLSAKMLKVSELILKTNYELRVATTLKEPDYCAHRLKLTLPTVDTGVTRVRRQSLAVTTSDSST